MSSACRWSVLAALGLAQWLALGALPARADIWKLVDENGHVHLSNRPLGPGSRLIARSAGSRDAARRADLARENRRRYAPLVDRVAARYRISAQLVHAVVRAESAYDPRAVSRAGAVGLMQLMPETAARYGVRDRRDPAANLDGGVRYLIDLLEQFDSVTLALAAYNAGEGAVIRHGNRVPPYPETQGYVRKVLVYYRELRSTPDPS